MHKEPSPPKKNHRTHNASNGETVSQLRPQNMWAQSHWGGAGGGQGEAKGVLLVSSGGVVLLRQSGPAVVAYLSMPQHQRLRWRSGWVGESEHEARRKSLCDRGWGVKEEMDENDEKQMEGVHGFNFSLRDYLPVTQVELRRCIVGRLSENIPSFLWL